MPVMASTGDIRPAMFLVLSSCACETGNTLLVSMRAKGQSAAICVDVLRFGDCYWPEYNRRLSVPSRRRGIKLEIPQRPRRSKSLRTGRCMTGWAFTRDATGCLCGGGCLDWHAAS